eukprot:PhM_4_TR2692/c0_g1_i1/m.63834/K03327/TC.MATE, SLC47A, norM, mdtK, dinF; multidrug resistance protein, MATE family
MNTMLLRQLVPEFRHEAKVQLSFAGPLAFTTLCRIVIFTTSLVFLGRVSTAALAADGLSNTICDVVCIFLQSCCTNILPLCSQAFGAKNRRLMVVWLHMSYVICAIHLIILIPATAFLTGPILRLVGIDEHVIYLAQTFNYINAFRLLPQQYYQSTRLYLQSMGIVHPALVVSCATCLLNIPLHYIFITGLQLGAIGAPVAMFVTSLLQILLLIAYISFVKSDKDDDDDNELQEVSLRDFHWSDFTLKRLRTFNAMYWGGFTSNAVEMGILAAVSVIAARLGTTALAAHNILGNVWNLLWAIFWGVSGSLMMRVAHFLGAGDVSGVRRSINVCLLMSVVIAAVLGPITALRLGWLSRVLFSPNDDALTAVVDACAPFFSGTGMTMLFAFHGISVLTGAGRPGVSGVFGIVSSVFIQLPLCYILGLVVLDGELGVSGLWLGNWIGEATRLVACGLFIRYRVVWDREVAAAQRRSEWVGDRTSNNKNVDVVDHEELGKGSEGEEEEMGQSDTDVIVVVHSNDAVAMPTEHDGVD